MSTQTTNRPEDIIFEQCLAGRLRLLNRVVTNMYDEALRPLGMKTSQLNILVAGAKQGLARPADICDRLQLDTSTLSRNVYRMKAKGWLEVVGDKDGRAQPPESGLRFSTVHLPGGWGDGGSWTVGKRSPPQTLMCRPATLLA